MPKKLCKLYINLFIRVYRFDINLNVFINNYLFKL